MAETAAAIVAKHVLAMMMIMAMKMVVMLTKKDQGYDDGVTYYDRD